MRARHLTALLTTLAVTALMGGCTGGRSDVRKVHVTGGDSERGARLIRDIGCGACHTIPGIEGARGVVGPPLSFWSRRTFIAGNLPNSPDNLIRWIRDADAVEAGTAMPDLDLSEQQARDVAAYLYTLD